MKTIWDTCELNNIADVKGGKRLPKGRSLVDEDTGHPYIRISDIIEKGISVNNIKFVPFDVVKKIKSYRIFEGDLYITVAGTVGLAGKLPKFLDGANLTENADRITNISKDVDVDYLLYVIRSDIIQREVKKVITQSAQPKLALTRIKKFEIPIPPLPEQRKIAEILSAWDEAIEKTERLIAALQTRKKGLMQRLLTGQVRFRVFIKTDQNKESKIGNIPTDWRVEKLGDITNLSFSNVDKVTEIDEISVKLCNYLDVYNYRYITNDLYFMVGSATESEINRFFLQKNDVIITKDSETSDEIAESAVVIDDLDNVVCGYHLAILRPKDKIIDGSFLMFMLHEQNVHIQFVKLANGITRYGLTIDAIKNAFIPVPNLDEQYKIVDVLKTCDDDIYLLEKKLHKLRIQKKGLMQRLLTGQVRVNVDKEE